MKAFFSRANFDGPASNEADAMTASAFLGIARHRPSASADGSDSFRQALRQLASGVSLVTSGEGRAKIGLTATAVSPMSLDPPTLVICLDLVEPIRPALTVGARLGLSILAAGQAEFADRFASRSDVSQAERFAEGRWFIMPGGVSVLADAAAIFECEIEDIIERHGRAILIARARLAVAGALGGALIHWRGGYDQIGWSAEEVSRAIGLAPTSPAERLGPRGCPSAHSE
jgi:flavin reductase (DIM6/NTAB) family NADH-FMN oxidoreductase RutF